MPSLKDLKNRINSVKSTRKITSAMKMVAEAQAVRAQETAEAIERGVFGAPTYFFEDQMLWGQDRLEFLERMLAGK